MGFLVELLGIAGLIFIIVAVLAFVGILHVAAVAFLIAGIIALCIYFAITRGGSGPWYHRGYRRY